MTVPPDRARQGRGIHGATALRDGHANRDLHRPPTYSLAPDLSSFHCRGCGSRPGRRTGSRRLFSIFSCSVARRLFLGVQRDAVPLWWAYGPFRKSIPIFGAYARSKVNVMDTRTLVILGLGIVVLLLLGFFALPA